MLDKADLATLQAQTQNMDTESFLSWAFVNLAKPSEPSLSFATSLGAEDQVLLWLLEKLLAKPLGKVDYKESLEVFSLDTGRLPEQTYTLIQDNRAFFKTPIALYFPDYKAVETMTAKHGVNLFYTSVELRKACCHVRKVEPLKRALAGKTAWISGQRRSQSITRSGIERLEWDEGNQMFKLNPLADWSHEQVWHVIKKEQLPYNSLHDNSYPSLGCAPCTRAVKAGEDERAGRWWWEEPENKECGLHLDVSAKPAKFNFDRAQ